MTLGTINYLSDKIADLITRTKGLNDIHDDLGKIIFPISFWSDLDDSIVLNDTAGDKNLPNVTIEDLPAGYTIERAVMMFKHGGILDSSGAENKTVDAQVMSIDASAARDSVVTAINIPSDSFLTPADSWRGGDVIIGDNDISAEVTTEATYYPTWELADVTAASLTFYEVQTGILVWYSI